MATASLASIFHDQKLRQMIDAALQLPERFQSIGPVDGDWTRFEGTCGSRGVFHTLPDGRTLLAVDDRIAWDHHFGYHAVCSAQASRRLYVWDGRRCRPLREDLWLELAHLDP